MKVKVEKGSYGRYTISTTNFKKKKPKKLRIKDIKDISIKNIVDNERRVILKKRKGVQ